jgi:hypothetical protein
VQQRLRQLDTPLQSTRQGFYEVITPVVKSQAL